MSTHVPRPPRYRVGVDIGGTFTDFYFLDEATGSGSTFKVLSTPDSPGSEVMAGLAQLNERHGIAPEAIVAFTHGTTVGVNTVIQRRGATLALLVTKGFADVLEVARLKTPDPYDLFSRNPLPLVARRNVFEVEERTRADGSILTALNEESVRQAVDRAKAAGAGAIVVALLHAYANRTHEQRVRELIADLAPDLDVILSSDVWPVIREYERTVTATVAGYVQRRVAHYIGALQDGLATRGVTCEPMVTKSNGGIMRAELGKSAPIQILLSGTASGVIGACHIAAAADEPNVLSFDVGGTSADVAVILNGEPHYSTGELVGEFPIYVPTVSVTSIGAGGGSIAHVDQHGVLKVGPASAGSVPGPACYGRGGTDATITDAYAVCGWLGSGELGYGAVKLDLEAARAAVAAVGERAGMSLEETAEAIIKVSISGVFLEVSKLFSHQGADPRHFALLPFGGAGPMTACLLARDLGLKKILVPAAPGVLAAFGGLISDTRNDFIRTVLRDVDTDAAAMLKTTATELEEQALHWLNEEQAHRGASTLTFSGDMRYRGQSYEIEVPLERSWLSDGDVAAIARAFHDAHDRVYDFADRNAECQIVNLRAVITGHVPKPKEQRSPVRERAAAPSGNVQVFLDGRWQAAGIYDRDKLEAGDWLVGPAIIRQADCTTCVVDAFTASVDAAGNLVIAKEG